ncbi:glycosyltransferase [Phenylobacterium sp.]|uniref:glycosyltransferase n=1 Tax=Phenylobacterium sp. TaxID=1871053 RepID=UPI002FE22255
MKICHVVPHIDREASGPSYSVPALCDALGRRGHEVVLLTLARGPVTTPQTFRHEQFPVSAPPARLGISRGLREALVRECADADVVHGHSLWMMPNVYPAVASRRTGTPLVISPRGTLGAAPLTYSKWTKRLFWAAAQGAAVRQASLLHATSEQERDEIRAFGLTKPVAVIPNGVDIPDHAPRPVRGQGPRRLLYLGRLHPKKGIELLLAAWRGLSTRHPDWELHLVGPGPETYVAELRRLAAELDLPRVTFAGGLYGHMKRQAYAEAELYVLPSLNENFGMSVAEALSHGVPVVTTRGTPWGGLVDQGCGWWAPADVAGIEATLDEALGVSEDRLATMGAAGRRWVTEAFSWARIASDMEDAYLQLSHRRSERSVA